MRILLKILLLPISLILTLVIYVSIFLVGSIGTLLNIISGLLFLGAVLMSGFAIFKSDIYTWEPAVVLAVVSFIISPYGLPKLAELLVVRLSELNELIKEI